jgi:hypothetical protein
MEKAAVRKKDHKDNKIEWPSCIFNACKVM